MNLDLLNARMAEIGKRPAVEFTKPGRTNTPEEQAQVDELYKELDDFVRDVAAATPEGTEFTEEDRARVNKLFHEPDTVNLAEEPDFVQAVGIMRSALQTYALPINGKLPNWKLFVERYKTLLSDG